LAVSSDKGSGSISVLVAGQEHKLIVDIGDIITTGG